MLLDLSTIRSQFPTLSRDAIFLDNPAGTQVTRTVLDRMKDYLVEYNANHGAHSPPTASRMRWWRK
jgi:selenocysteine lyase/cysteine desulfurase